MGMDLQSAIVMVGKAMNDPIANLSAMSRAGIQFSEDQKKMIFSLVKTGDMLGAQKIILGELTTQFGGSAAAAARTYAGELDTMSNAFGDLAEKLGERLVPELSLIVSFLQEAIASAQKLGILKETGPKIKKEKTMRMARLEDVTKEDIKERDELIKTQKENLNVLKEQRRQQESASWGTVAMGPAYYATDWNRRREERARLDEKIKTKERGIAINIEEREKMKVQLADPKHQAGIDRRAAEQKRRDDEIHQKALEANAAEREDQRGVIADQQAKIERLEAKQDDLQKSIDATFASPAERREDRKRQIELNGMIKQQNEILKQQQAELDKLRAA